MTVPDQKEIVSEMAVAREMLDDAEDDLSEQRHRSAVSRAYYAIFHAARSALWSKGITTKTHKGLIQKFGANLVKTGIITEQYNDILTNAHDERELADYAALSGSFDNNTVKKLVADARIFVSKMEELLSTKDD